MINNADIVRGVKHPEVSELNDFCIMEVLTANEGEILVEVISHEYLDVAGNQYWISPQDVTDVLEEASCAGRAVCTPITNDVTNAILVGIL